MCDSIQTYKNNSEIIKLLQWLEPLDISKFNLYKRWTPHITIHQRTWGDDAVLFMKQ